MTVTGLAARLDGDLRDIRHSGSSRRLLVYAIIASLSFIAYILARVVEGAAAFALTAVGVSACGWAWLLARALFDPTPKDAGWPRAVVAVLTATGAIASLAVPGGLISGMAIKLYAISGSAALLLTLIEPLQRHGWAITPGELRFRIVVAVVFSALVGAAVLAVWFDPKPIQTLCAIVGLGGAIAATAYRLRHPLKKAARATAAPRRIRDEDADLSDRLMRLLQDQAIYAEPDLRACDVAMRLGAPEYRISRCVSRLGFPNFNRLINHHRIALAQSLLSDPREERSILDIAMDCGFASTGPFNRAFKAETGTTPRNYRRDNIRTK